MEWGGVTAAGLLTLLHVLLFVFWLGADLGVFYTAKYVARADLSKAERLRFLELLLRLDMFPRSSLILMLPVGFSLAHVIGWAPLSPIAMILIWSAGIAWFVLMWSVHKRPQALQLKKLDVAVRGAVMAALIGVAVISLANGMWSDQAWLSLKLLLFAAVIGLGLLLRGSVALWIKGFGLLEADADAGNALITKGHKEATRFAHTLWLLLIVMAFLGVSKPLL
ncbi:MAG: hypothetical protein AAF337_12650 [Pseudomonadota bacterium]